MSRGRPRKARGRIKAAQEPEAPSMKVCCVSTPHGVVEIVCNNVMIDMHGELLLVIEGKKGESGITAGFKEWSSFTFKDLSL